MPTDSPYGLDADLDELLPYGPVQVRNGDAIVGHVTNGYHCENDACIIACGAGRPFHATPAGFAVTLATYHYATLEEARAALVEADAARLERAYRGS